MNLAFSRAIYRLLSRLISTFALSAWLVPLAYSLSACSSDSADDRPVISVSIEPQRKILEEIAGDGFRVVSIIGNGANPETFEPSIAQRVDLDNSKAYFKIGFLPFEDNLTESLTKNVMICNVSDGIPVITGTHSHGDGSVHENTPDPHVWTSLRNSKIIAANMLAAMKTLCPDSADLYQKRYDNLVSRLDSLDAIVSRRLSDAGVDGFAVWHPSLTYYARDYGLHQIAIGQESKELSPATLRHIIDHARQDSVKVFFFQKEYDSRQAESINNEIGSRLVTINPLDYQWEDEIIKITDELTQ